MRSFLLFAFLILFSFPAFSSVKTDSLLEQLKNEFSRKHIYDQRKEQVIQSLKASLNKIPKNNLVAQFDKCSQLYDEYKSYQYDSAYVFATKLQELSHAMKDKGKEDYSKIKLGFILLSSGMFKETFDNLSNINIEPLDDSVKIEYYSLMTRTYYDLANYDNDRHYAPYYNAMANKYIDSAIAISKPNSYNKIYLTGYKKLKNGQLQEASVDFIELMDHHALTDHQKAIVYSTLSTIYSNTKREQSTDLLLQASINDIRSSTKETVALFWLAELLYKSGDVNHAYIYLQQALADAEFYGARQRKIQIGTLLPIVASDRLNFIESEKRSFIIYMVTLTVLALLVVWFSVMLFRRLNDLKAKEKIIDDKNIQLERINEKLLEGTKIKEDYIGYFFNVISGYILQLEKLKRSVDTKLRAKKYDDIQIVVDKINIKKERDTLFYTFDHVFIKIFPNFITEFNAMFRKEDQIWPKEDEVLTTDLRIFALIRMGISDTETIAKILEYSEKTIYVYKMRIKAKAISSDQFEHRIMAIKAVDISNKA
ncbi:DUF6377 domain-containing protein [Mucilaginibacter paludis]|uniref:DUF6377 domain-containing protein n=1 Tax=Mucilaginibacter paludis DSM 18603 TaxID=714943 RepID=H1YBA3_9SPHI|nr:DUF6377 domain-containing protein [Mucilaginibacter paludis]EHQ30629.1 hypothetical protein Mucpa_6578 [Mucilaginibacter paludis DSM 18603]